MIIILQWIMFCVYVKSNLWSNFSFFFYIYIYKIVIYLKSHIIKDLVLIYKNWSKDILIFKEKGKKILKLIIHERERESPLSRIHKEVSYPNNATCYFSRNNNNK